MAQIDDAYAPQRIISVNLNSPRRMNPSSHFAYPALTMMICFVTFLFFVWAKRPEGHKTQ